MAQVTVIVNGRTYRLMCGPGEESRLTDLADHIRQRIDDLSYEFGNAGDERLLLMAAIMVTDELWDTKARLAEVERVARAWVDNADATLELELVIERGRGYRPAEAQESLTIGEIPLDAIFTPITKVNYTSEHTRVGALTDYDKLTLEIVTNGTIDPGDALSQAAQILVEYGQVIAGFNSEERPGMGAIFYEQGYNEFRIVLGELLDALDTSARAAEPT